jgi:hypothetical protein
MMFSIEGGLRPTSMIPTVSDKRSRILEVVVVRRIYLTWVLGIWSREGLRRVEKGEVSLRVT